MASTGVGHTLQLSPFSLADLLDFTFGLIHGKHL